MASNASRVISPRFHWLMASIRFCGRGMLPMGSVGMVVGGIGDHTCLSLETASSPQTKGGLAGAHNSGTLNAFRMSSVPDIQSLSSHSGARHVWKARLAWTAASLALLYSLALGGFY